MAYSELRVDTHFYSKPFPHFKKPNIIGYININNLKYACNIREENVNFDLNVHLDKAKRKPLDLDVKLTDLLKFLLEHKVRLNFPMACKLEDSIFFCYRGLMTCVACTPYENRDGWKIVALLYKGHIYLCARDTEEKLKRKMCMTEKEKQFQSWGFKFEQYMLSDSPKSNPNPNIPVDETEEFSLVFSTQLKRHKIVYGAEMDGIRCDKQYVEPLPNSQNDIQNIIHYLSSYEFIELKTNRHFDSLRQEGNFKKFKTKKWWCQSFLVGIDTILCGFRNDLGLVEELKLYSVSELPKMSKKFWDPSVCFNFLETFLTFVKRSLERKIRTKYGSGALQDINKLPLISLLFEWQGMPGSAIEVSDSYCHEEDPILQDWFLRSFGKEHEFQT